MQKGHQRLILWGMLALRILIEEEGPVKQSGTGGKTKLQYYQIQVKRVFQGGDSSKMMLVEQVRCLE